MVMRFIINLYSFLNIDKLLIIGRLVKITWNLQLINLIWKSDNLVNERK